MEFAKKSILRRLIERMYPDINVDKAALYAEGFLHGSEYGYNYHANTSFPDSPWSDYCKGNSRQKTISLNPYHPLNELED